MGQLNETERYLLEQIRQGSAEGWSQFIDRYQGRLLAFARNRAQRAADAEDLVQETLISFLRALPGFREEAGFETYLFAILRRKIIDSYRGRKVSVCLLQDVLAGQGAVESAGADACFAAPDPTASWYARADEQHERRKTLLTTALRDVIEHYKQARNFRDLQIVEMIYYCQLRNKDIGEIAGVGEKHVAMIKHRTLGRLRERIGAKGVDDEAWVADDLLSTIWQEQRLSCLKRSTLGAFLLSTLEADWRAYVTFHLDRLGCAYCNANLDDLKAQNSRERTALRQRVMESTVGFLCRQ